MQSTDDKNDDWQTPREGSLNKGFTEAISVSNALYHSRDHLFDWLTFRSAEEEKRREETCTTFCISRCDEISCNNSIKHGSRLGEHRSVSSSDVSCSFSIKVSEIFDVVELLSNWFPRIDPRKPVCRLCETMTSVYWRVPARNVLLCNNCFVNDCKNIHRFCKLKRLDTNVEVLPTFDARFHLSTQMNKDEQVASSSASSSSSMITKMKRPKASEPVKSQLTLKISTRMQPSLRSNRKTMAFKSKKVGVEGHRFLCNDSLSSRKNVYRPRRLSNYSMFSTRR